MDPIIFMAKVGTHASKRAARLLIASQRAFGREMSGCPFRVFNLAPQDHVGRDFDSAAARIIPLDVPKNLLGYHCR